MISRPHILRIGSTELTFSHSTSTVLFYIFLCKDITGYKNG
jgi:hypothetical protein